MKEVVEGLARKHMFDVVIASQVDMAPYAVNIKTPVRILEELEISGYIDAKAQQRSPLGQWRHALTLFKTRRYFRSTAGKFDGVTVVSNREQQEIIQLFHNASCVEVIPNGVDLDWIGSQTDHNQPEPDSLLYSGSVTYFANLDAVRYFLQDIFPLVLKERPQARFYISGSTKGVDLSSQPLQDPLLKDRVIFTGYLPDIRRRVIDSWASVVPLRQGGGTRLKILESLALGTPVISTSKGAEGLNLKPGRDYLMANTPDEFAACVIQLLKDAELRRTLSLQGRKAVEEMYDWDQIGKRFLEFLERVRVEQRKL
jgi:glycosyltransferase involved in cell wall biosynthesis